MNTTKIDEILTGVWASGVYDQADGEGDCITDDTPIDIDTAKAQIQALITQALQELKDELPEKKPEMTDAMWDFPDTPEGRYQQWEIGANSKFNDCLTEVTNIIDNKIKGE